MLDWAIAKGGTVDLDAFLEAINNSLFQIPPLPSLKYLHEKLGYTRSPFKVTIHIPYWATAEALQWLNERGYQFDFDGVLQTTVTSFLFDVEVISWILNQRIEPNANDFLRAACHCRIDILELLWSAKPAHLTPEYSDAIIGQLIDALMTPMLGERFRYRPFLKTIKWLLDKGYTWGPHRDYDRFALHLFSNKPNFCRKYLQEIIDLNIPLSEFCQKALDPIIKKVHPRFSCFS